MPGTPVAVLDNDKSHAAHGRDMMQELLQGLQAAGRRADTDNGERFRPGGCGI